MVPSKMSIRGHERFTTKPLSVTTNLGRQPSAMDVQRRAILQMQEEEASRIKTQEDFKRDFLDFSMLTEVDDFGLPTFTPYAVPDEVPDMYVPSSSAIEEKDSPNGSDSVESEPVAGE